MKFLLDRYMAVRHARALNALTEPEHSFVHINDRFGAASRDSDWIGELASEGGWVVLSGDVRAGQSAHECSAWRDSGLAIFFLTRGWANLPALEQHAKLALLLPKIIARAENASPGCGFTVPVTGKIEPLFFRPNC